MPAWGIIILLCRNNHRRIVNLSDRDYKNNQQRGRCGGDRRSSGGCGGFNPNQKKFKKREGSNFEKKETNIKELFFYFKEL